MKNFRLLAMRLGAATLIAVLATSVMAQDQGGPPQGGPGGFGGRGGMRMGPPAVDKLPALVTLADRPEVVTELNLSDDQQDKIASIIDALRESMRPQGGGQDGPPQGPPPVGQQGARDKAEAAADVKIKAVLSATQAKRITEIQIQSMGLTAAMVPSIQTKLGLTDDQKAKLKALIPARGQRPGGQGGPGDDMGGPPPGGPGGGGFDGPPQGGPPQGGPGGDGGPGQGGPGGLGQRGGGMDGRKKQLETKIAAILTVDQKATLKALGGKVIKLEMRGPGGPGGPGGGPGGPGGGPGGPGGPRN